MTNLIGEQITTAMPSSFPLQSKEVRSTSRSNHLFSVPMILVFIVLMLSFMVFIFDQILRPGYFTIERIDIQGMQRRVDPRIIERAAWRYVNGNYFSANLSLIEERLKEIPGIYAVAVRRVWPSALQVFITESEGLAKWSTLAADSSTISTKFVNLPPNRVFDLIPELSGPALERQVVLNTYLEADQILWPLGLEITEVSLSRSAGWTFKIRVPQFSSSSNFSLVIGRHNPIDKINDFIDVYELALRNQVQLISSIDLRYPNGLAVRWSSFSRETLSQGD